ncbi:hypothetical protein L1887_03514 [Cichorium endivia]|nr:hypothetical protein L1887_03514 [Cichorium endivia]
MTLNKSSPNYSITTEPQLPTATSTPLFLVFALKLSCPNCPIVIVNGCEGSHISISQISFTASNARAL